MRKCEHKPKTKVMWGPSGNRIPPEGGIIDPFPAVCEKCGALIQFVWLDSLEMAKVAQEGDKDGTE